MSLHPSFASASASGPASPAVIQPSPSPSTLTLTLALQPRPLLARLCRARRAARVCGRRRRALPRGARALRGAGAASSGKSRPPHVTIMCGAASHCARCAPALAGACSPVGGRHVWVAAALPIQSHPSRSVELPTQVLPGQTLRTKMWRQAARRAQSAPARRSPRGHPPASEATR